VPVLVKDGRLDLSFAASAGQTEISGISIAPSSGVLTTSGRVKPALTTTTATTDGVQRISTRTSAYTDRSGKVWSAERGFTGGYRVDVSAAEITGTDDDPLYRSEHWGMTGFSTAVPAAGTYNVTLKFARTTTAAPTCAASASRPRDGRSSARSTSSPASARTPRTTSPSR
jgi:hypothetical protein